MPANTPCKWCDTPLSDCDAARPNRKCCPDCRHHKRIQRKRTAGWRMPEGAIYVGRPSRWGNPIRITPEHGRFCTMYRVHGSPLDRNGGPSYADIETARHFAAKAFEWDLLNGRYPDYPSLDEIRRELAGHDLACWCPPRRTNRNGSLGDISCHADVLLEIANATTESEVSA